MRASFRFIDSDGVVESLDAVMAGLEDMTPFFASLRDPWFHSRRALYDTQGGSADVDWPLYEDTPEQDRYVYAKGAILGMDGPVDSTDVLMWGGPNRLHAAVTGDSSEASWTSDERSATMRVEVEYASSHDKGEGTAPDWAWPAGQPYETPQRRLTAMGGGDREGSFQLLFSARLGEYMAETGARLGMKSDDVVAELMRTYAPRETP